MKEGQRDESRVQESCKPIKRKLVKLNQASKGAIAKISCCGVKKERI